MGGVDLDRPAVCRQHRLLSEMAHARAARSPGRSRIWFQLAGSHAQQRRLARTVWAGHHQPTAAGEQERHRLGQPPGDPDVVDSQEDPGRCGQIGEPEDLRRLWDQDGMGVERGLVPVHALHEPAGAGRTPVLVGALLRAPARDEAALRGGEVVVPPGMLCPLAFVLRLPPFPLCQASHLAGGITAAIDPRAVVGCRVEVDDGLGKVGQQSPIVGADDDTPAAHPELRRQELKPAAVQVVGALVEQHDVVVGAEETCQADPVPLPDGEISQRSDRVGLRVEGFERDPDAPLGVPRVERPASSSARMLLGRPVPAVGESAGGAVECRECGQRLGYHVHDSLSHGPSVGSVHLLFGESDHPGVTDGSIVGQQRASEDVQEGGLASPFSPTIAMRDDGVTARSTRFRTRVAPRVTATSEAVSWGGGGQECGGSG